MLLNAPGLSPRRFLYPMLKADVQNYEIRLASKDGVILQERAVADSGNPTAAFLVDLERTAGGAENRNQCKTRH